jgi:hypothetical protein
MEEMKIDEQKCVDIFKFLSTHLPKNTGLGMGIDKNGIVIYTSVKKDVDKINSMVAENFPGIVFNIKYIGKVSM